MGTGLPVGQWTPPRTGGFLWPWGAGGQEVAHLGSPTQGLHQPGASCPGRPQDGACVMDGWPKGGVSRTDSPPVQVVLKARGPLKLCVPRAGHGGWCSRKASSAGTCLGTLLGSPTQRQRATLSWGSPQGPADTSSGPGWSPSTWPDPLSAELLFRLEILSGLQAPVGGLTAVWAAPPELSQSAAGVWGSSTEGVGETQGGPTLGQEAGTGSWPSPQAGEQGP